MSDILNQLKHNRTPWGWLTDEERDYFRKNKNHMDICKTRFVWEACTATHQFCDNDILRIKANYQPEPENLQIKINQLKHNRTPWRWLTDEERDYFRKNKNHMDICKTRFVWEACTATHQFCDNDILRIKANYQPEPENLQIKIKQLQAELAEHRWIPVSERLPELFDLAHPHSADVLIYTKDEEVYIGWYTHTPPKGWRYDDGTFKANVTHWTPIILPRDRATP